MNYKFCISTPIPILENVDLCDLKLQTIRDNSQGNLALTNICGTGRAHDCATYLRVTWVQPSVGSQRHLA
jgi:hypothetical protein